MIGSEIDYDPWDKLEDNFFDLLISIKYENEYGGPPIDTINCKRDYEICNVKILSDKLTELFRKFETIINEKQETYLVDEIMVGKMSIFLDLTTDMKFQLIDYPIAGGNNNNKNKNSKKRKSSKNRIKKSRKNYGV
jgi:hypothetical protein